MTRACGCSRARCGSRAAARPSRSTQEKLATFEKADTVYNQRDAEGFIKLNALRLLRGD